MGDSKPLAIAVGLDEGQILSLEKQARSENITLGRRELLESLGTTALSDMAGGGLMIEPRYMERVRKVIGSDAGQHEIVNSIENAASVDGDVYVAKWRLDPTYVPVLKERANAMGVTIEWLIQDLMDTAWAQGWFWAIDPQPRRYMFSPEDVEMIAEAVGKKSGDLTGTDMANFIRQNTQLPVGAE